MQVYLRLKRGWREVIAYVPINHHFREAVRYRRFPSVWVEHRDLMTAGEVRSALLEPDRPVHIWMTGEDPRKVKPWKVVWAEFTAPH